jgi:hypothetical protein
MKSYTVICESGFTMLAIDSTIFLLKLLLVPVFIGTVSLAGRRWGSTVGGWLVGLPLSSAPVALILALEQGDLFASRAAQGIMLGIVSVYAFCVVYGWVAMRFGWLQSTLAGVVVFLASTLLLDVAALPFWLGTTLAVFALLVTVIVMPRVGDDRASGEHARWEIPLRMISATLLVFVITGVAALLGPQLTGLLTPFPVYATTMAVFIHRSQGGEEAVKLLRGVVVGTLTFIVFFLIISGTIIDWGIGSSFLAAIVGGLLTHFTSLQALRYRHRISKSIGSRFAQSAWRPK